jgi:hypothetical protein
MLLLLAILALVSAQGTLCDLARQQWSDLGSAAQQVHNIVFGKNSFLSCFL